MPTEYFKKIAAEGALAYIPPGGILGVGTGSTVNYFIDAIAARGTRIVGAVASSQATAHRLSQQGIPLIDLDTVDRLSVYVDGADEVTPQGHMIKGGGGALTREKIIAAASDRFVCIVDQQKHVQQLGAFPLPIEVIPMAIRQVESALRKLGGTPSLRQGFTTDNGNLILDVAGLTIGDPIALERTINQWPGVVTVGLFTTQHAHIVLTGTKEGLHTLTISD